MTKLHYLGVGVLALILNGCATRNLGPKGDQGESCTLSGLTITCPDGTMLTVPQGPRGDAGATGPQGPAGAAGSTITVTILSFPLVTTCLALNATTWAKRSAGTNIDTYATAACTGSIGESLTHTGNEIFWSGPRQFYIMDTLTTMKKIDF